MVVRPRPGGRAPAPAAEPPPPEADASVQGRRLLPIAMPLLQLMARLRTAACAPDEAVLRQRISAGLAQFEGRAANSATADQLRRAHYALCVSVDAAMLATPWGAAGAWARQTLTAEHHPVVPAARFLDVLRQAEGRGAEALPLVELMHACLSLGLDAALPEAEPARAGAYAFIRQHTPPPAPELAAEWRGVHAPFTTRRILVPLWVVASAGLALVAGGYLLASNLLADASDVVFAAAVAAPPSQMPQITRDVPVVPPAPAPPDAAGPSARDQLRDRLRAAGVAAELAGTAEMPVVRLPARAMFRPGSATLLPAATGVLAKLGPVLREEGGSVAVLGYTDARPFRSVQFASNYELSAARAKAVLAAIPGDIAGWTAEGRGPADAGASVAIVLNHGS